MNDEIKEIIELINTKYEDYYIDDFLSGEDVKKLVEYINNLQQTCDDNVREYEKLLKMYNDNVDKYEDLLEKYFNIQQRIYKARKMIFDNYGLLDKYEIEMLDDILKGDSDE